jgi:hypothetical protein
VSPSKTYRDVRRAIRQHRAIAFTYRGKPRYAYPVVLGYGADGREALIAYQIGGATSEGRKLPGWRCFYLESDGDVIPGDKHTGFEGDSHKRPQACVQYTDVDINIPETLKRTTPLPFGSNRLRKPRR